MRVLLDTSAFIAMAYPKDARHVEALEKRDRCATSRDAFYASEAVLYETLNWLAVRLGPRAAAEFGRSVWLRSPHLSLLALEPEDKLGALAVLEKFAQIELSFVDASNIHLFHRRRFHRLFSFDRQFAQANIPLL